MIEFTSEPQKTFRPITLVIALGILAILLGGVAYYVHYQGGIRTRPGSPILPPVEGLLRAGNTNFEFYKTRIHIDNVKATLGISLNGVRTATVAGTIVNDGDRTLEALELHITLYDMWGKVSKERTAFALRPGGYNWKPIGPLEKRGFSISAESVEYYWNPKQVTFEITGLKYQ
jgi:hypothetical protein